MKLTFKILLLFITFIISSNIHAQKDTLFLKNKDIIDGKIKDMDKAILHMSTDYSDENFAILWSEIEKLNTNNRFYITLSNRKTIICKIKTIGEDSILLTNGKKHFLCNRSQIVYIKGFEESIRDRVKASIDLGFNMAKANHLIQLNMRSNFEYSDHHWTFVANMNITASKQDSIAPTQMKEASVGVRYAFENDFFFILSSNLLSNTEQALKLRSNANFGLGRFLIHTNKLYLTVATGVGYMHERFSNDTPTKKSFENYVGTELNLFKTNNVSLQTGIIVYRSLTENKRWRSDMNLDVKFNLPLNFYIQNGITVNFDNQPAISGNNVDYNLMVTLGWEF